LPLGPKRLRGLGRGRLDGGGGSCGGGSGGRGYQVTILHFYFFSLCSIFIFLLLFSTHFSLTYLSLSNIFLSRLRQRDLRWLYPGPRTVIIILLYLSNFSSCVASWRDQGKCLTDGRGKCITVLEKVLFLFSFTRCVLSLTYCPLSSIHCKMQFSLFHSLQSYTYYLRFLFLPLRSFFFLLSCILCFRDFIKYLFFTTF